jgi:uncharacterized OB-fold protein
VSIKDVVEHKTLEAVRHYGDDAIERFYRELRARRFMSTRCGACASVAFPPRGFCPRCWSREVAWVELPRRGTVYAFTQQDRTFRFGKPDVIGLVELEGVGHVLTRIDAPFEALRIGQEVELDFVVLREDLVLHQFRPAARPAIGAQP